MGLIFKEVAEVAGMSANAKVQDRKSLHGSPTKSIRHGKIFPTAVRTCTNWGVFSLQQIFGAVSSIETSFEVAEPHHSKSDKENQKEDSSTIENSLMARDK